jgi:hypothetical protein
MAAKVIQKKLVRQPIRAKGLSMRPSLASTIFLALLGIHLVLPQYLIADFYVIPIGPGTKSINYSDVRHLGTERLINPNFNDILIDLSTQEDFNVPDDKIFIVTNVVLTCGDSDSTTISSGSIRFGSSTQRIYFKTGQTIQWEFPIGIPMSPGDHVTVWVTSVSDVGVYAHVSGYLTNP